MAEETIIQTIIRIRLTRNKLIPVSTPWLLILSILALCGFVIVLFLPALWELRRPRDPGPRRIDEATIEKDD